MHVAQLSFYLDAVGRSPDELLHAWPTLSAVAEAALGAGVRVTVIQASCATAHIERNGIAYQFVPVPQASLAGWPFGRRVRLASRTILQRVAELGPDTIHLQGLSFPVQTRLVTASLPRIPVLVQDHGDGVPRPWRRPLHRWGLARIAGVAFTAREQAAPFIEAGVLRCDLPVFEVVESSSWFTPGEIQPARERTGLHGDPCLLWIGRLDANKDPLMVLDALSRAAPSLPDPQLWCCYSKAPLLERVRQRLAAEPQLATRVHLLGSVPHETVEELCRAADFLVLGSHWEGSGYAVLEALACGTTPLVTDIPSFRRMTGGGAVGALSPPGDADAMARALIEWSGRDRAVLRRAARDFFERELSFEAVGVQLRTAYEAVLGGR
ncbi:MAG: glycosyltransferase family 4 protein [Gemmatimonadetes bacterium]|nr:glycosyltransferase family 4 protein [Gemmatimonadota bacterium]